LDDLGKNIKGPLKASGVARVENGDFDVQLAELQVGDGSEYHDGQKKFTHFKRARDWRIKEVPSPHIKKNQKHANQRSSGCRIAKSQIHPKIDLLNYFNYLIHHESTKNSSQILFLWSPLFKDRPTSPYYLPLS
jgi:hypothetical protein